MNSDLIELLETLSVALDTSAREALTPERATYFRDQAQRARDAADELKRRG